MLSNYLFPLLNIIFSTVLIYGPKMYVVTNNIMYIIVTVITTNLLIYVIYRMLHDKYNLIVTSLCGKIIPTVILGLISYLFFKEEKFTFIKGISLLMVAIGSYILIQK